MVIMTSDTILTLDKLHALQFERTELLRLYCIGNEEVEKRLETEKRLIEIENSINGSLEKVLTGVGLIK